MSNSLISVIIPVYNRETFLDKCIGSVLSQSGVNTEIILVDDGSTDNSPQICDSYASRYSNISVIHISNHGVGYAKNCALDKVTGDYLYFLDSDDSIPADALKKMQTALEETGADICAGPTARYNEDGKLNSVVYVPEEYKDKTVDIKTYLKLFSLTDQILVINLTAKLYKMDIWKDIRFPNMRCAEDDYLFTAVLDRISSVHILSSVVYDQTLTHNSLIRSEPAKTLLFGSKTRLLSLDYLIKKGYYDAALYRFGDGTRRLIIAKRLLKTGKEKKEIREQYKSFCRASKLLAPHVSKGQRIRFALFRSNLSLYGFIRDKFSD